MNVRKFRYLLFSVLFLFVLALVGCGNNSETSSGTTENDEQTASNEETTEEVESTNDEKQTDYPNRTIEIIAGGGPGGGTDVFSRSVAKELSSILGVNVNTINMPGAGGGIAAQEVANRPADGYTILPTNSDTHINMATGKTPDYLGEGLFTPLARLHSDTYSIVVKAGSEYEDFNEVIAAAKENPGEVTIAGTATKGMDEFTVRRLEKLSGIDLNYIPYEESGKMHAALLGGNVDLLIDEVGPVVQNVSDGNMALSLVFTENRLQDFPDVPTTVENGWDLTVGMDRGWIINADVPDDIKKILEEALKEAANAPEYKEFAKSSYLHLKDGWMNSEDYTTFMKSEIEIYKDLLSEME